MTELNCVLPRSYALTKARDYVFEQNRQTTPAPIDGVITGYAEKMMLTKSFSGKLSVINFLATSIHNTRT